MRRVCIVDLDDITFLDKSGERFLRVLARNGARFSPSGIYTKRSLESMSLKLCVWRARYLRSTGRSLEILRFPARRPQSDALKDVSDMTEKRICVSMKSA